MENQRFQVIINHLNPEEKEEIKENEETEMNEQIEENETSFIFKEEDNVESNFGEVVNVLFNILEISSS
jgi:hypothetical protein